MARPTEAQIERALREYLEAHGYLVIKTDAGAHAKWARRVKGHAIRGDVPTGFPDLVVLHPTRPAVFVEVKRPGGRLTDAQRLVHEYLRSAGYRVLVARSVEDLEELVGERGVDEDPAFQGALRKALAGHPQGA